MRSLGGDGGVVVDDEEGVGALGDGAEGAGGAEDLGAGGALHAELDVAEARADGGLGDGLVAGGGVGDDEVEAEVFHGGSWV